MKPLFTAVGTMDTDINVMVPGKIMNISLPAGEAVSFPPEAHYPEGGSFVNYVPAEALVTLQTEASGAGFPIPPGVWNLAFADADVAWFTAAASVVISVMQHREG